ncbi:SSI family serine proteinase inhibitor [Streptomyces sp. NPDC002537]
MPLRRLALTAVALAPVLLALPTASAAPLPLPVPDRDGDRLTVTITDSGHPDARYELYCHPDGGTHPRVKQACRQLDGQTRWGQDPFAPVPKDANCTMVYGGPERAHVFGSWAGRPVSTQFNRSNGCEIARWNKFSELLAAPDRSPKG